MATPTRYSPGSTTCPNRCMGAENSLAQIVAPAAAPISWGPMKPGTWLMAIPANVVVNPRASVTAGLANEVEDVNQYAAVIVSPTSHGIACGAYRTPPRIARTRVQVAEACA